MESNLTPPEELDFLGSTARILADGEDSDGRLGLVEMIVPPGHMAPLHVHHSEDEGFYLLEGELTIYTARGEARLRPGDFLLAERGVPHTYRVGDAPARWLITSTPAGFERFVAAVAALPSADPESLSAVAAEHEIEILGPPGARP